MEPPVVDSKRTNFPATVLAADVYEFGPPGAIRRINATSIKMACPGCGEIKGMTVGDPKPDNSNGATWLLTGDVNHPKTVTLYPSVNCVGCCGFHGWLKNGIYTSCN